MTKILQWSMLCQTAIFLCLLSSLCLLLCAWFSLIYCYAKYLHDHRWEVGFFAAVSILQFTLPNSGARIWRAAHTLIFSWSATVALKHGFARRYLLPEIPELASVCWGGKVSLILFKGLTGNYFFIFRKISCGGFHPAEYCFQNSLYFSWL